MSSRFAATICGHIIRRQSELGITGHFAEIGTFEGRFFIAMALGLAPGERALGIDTFNWPNDGLLDLFHWTLRAARSAQRERYTAIKAKRRELSADDITRPRSVDRSGSGISTAIIRARHCSPISRLPKRRCIRKASSASTTCCIPATRC